MGCLVFVLGFSGSLYVLNISQSLIKYVIHRYLLTFCGLPVTLLMVTFDAQRFLIFMRHDLSFCFFAAHAMILKTLFFSFEIVFILFHPLS